MTQESSIFSSSFSKELLQNKGKILGFILFLATIGSLFDALFVGGIRVLSLILSGKEIPWLSFFKVPQNHLTLLWIWTSTLSLVALLRTLLFIKRKTLETGLYIAFEQKLRIQLLNQALHEKAEDFRKHPLSYRLQQFGHDFRILEQGSEALLLGIQALIQTLILLPLLLWISAPLSLGIFFFAIPAVFISQKNIHQLKNLFHQSLEEKSHLQNSLYSFFHFTMNRIHISFVQKSKQIVSTEIVEHSQTQTKVASAKIRFHGISELISVLTTLALFSFAGWLVLQKAMTPVDLITFSSCLLLLYRPIKDLSRLFPLQREAENVWENFQPFLQKEKSQIHTKTSESNIIIQDLSFFYEPQNPVFQNFQCSIQEKEQCILRGPNGSGKSTLLKLLAELEIPNSGCIQMPSNIKNLGSVFLSQNPVLPPIPLKELFPSVPENSDAFQLRKQLGTNPLINNPDLKNAYTSWQENLSGGQRQRLALNLVLESKSPLILLDEPTSSLPLQDREAIFKSIIQWCEKNDITLISSSHENHFPPQIRLIDLGLHS